MKMTDKYKRYLLFAYDGNFPRGGEVGVIGSFETIDDAKKCITDSEKRYEFDQFDLLDMQDGLWVDY
jgi:hypothetical protein